MTKRKSMTPEEYKFSRTVAGGAQSKGLPATASLCATGVCHICGKVWISAIRAFPIPYACPGCNPEYAEKRRRQREEWLATHKICKNGHELTEETVYHTPAGKNECKKCKAEYRKEWARLARQPSGA